MPLPLAWVRKPQCYQVTSVPGNKLLMQSAGQLHCRRTAKAAAPVEELVSKIKHGELQERNGAGSEKNDELLFWKAGDALDSRANSMPTAPSAPSQAALALPPARYRAR
jgi:hypothetical protein